MKLKLRQTPLLYMLLKIFIGRNFLMVVTSWLYFGSISAEAHTTSYFQGMKTTLFLPYSYVPSRKFDPS